MPPKAKKKGKKMGKGKGKKEGESELTDLHIMILPVSPFCFHCGADGGELSVEEMYKRTLQEVGSLREQLGW